MIFFVNRFSRRSQPPLFVKMVSDLFEATGDKEFLAEMVGSLERELTWWRQNRTVTVRLGPKPDEQYMAYRYKVGETMAVNYGR